MAKATQLSQASGRFMRGSSLIDVQVGSCGSSKYTMLTYLDKNNSNEFIQTVSDEDKRKERNFCNTLCL
jgi:hypothetical protein